MRVWTIIPSGSRVEIVCGMGLVVVNFEKYEGTSKFSQEAASTIT